MKRCGTDIPEKKRAAVKCKRCGKELERFKGKRKAQRVWSTVNEARLRNEISYVLSSCHVLRNFLGAGDSV